MPQILISEELTHLTAGNSVMHVAQDTVRECLCILFAQYPQLYVFLMDNLAEESQRVLLILNDDELLEVTDITRKLNSSDTLHIFYGIPAGQYGAVTSAFIYAGLSAATAQLVAQVVVQVIIAVVASVVISAIMGSLVDDVATPDSTIASNSPTYTFEGVKNTTASGTPLCAVYGTHRVGGQILSLFTKSYSTTTGANTNTYTTDILYQLGLSEGEICSVTDIEINKLPSTYFNQVSIPDIRLGTKDQLPMLDFSMLENTTSIGRRVLNISSAIPVPARLRQDTEPVYGYVDGTRTFVPGPYVWIEPQQ